MAISTNFCTNGEWKEGNSIITIARNAIKNHNPKKIFESLGKLLKLISENFPEVDVRDRANFYYSILTHLPKEKLDEILDVKSLQHQHNEDSKQHLVHGEQFSHKNKTNHFEFNFLKFQKINKNKLNLFEKNENQQPPSSQNTSQDSSPNDFPEWDKWLQGDFKENSFLENESEEKKNFHKLRDFYFHSINTKNQSFSVFFYLSFSTNVLFSENQLSIPEKLFSAQLILEDNEFYEKVDPLLIPYLAKPLSSTLSKFDQPPFKYLLQFQFSPLFPLPSSFNVSLMDSSPFSIIFPHSSSKTFSKLIPFLLLSLSIASIKSQLFS